MKRLIAMAMLGAAVSAVQAAETPPLMMIRLQGSHTASDEQWAETFRILRENRPACDDVWLSTGQGCPSLEWVKDHARRLVGYADQLRSVGIEPSLQFQATIGHADHIFIREEGADGKTWSGFTGRGGTESRYCGCPRQPGFIAYYREAARLYAAVRPAWVWIDDDLRIMGHDVGSPWDKVEDGWIGCWCKTCIAAFNAETGGNWTRESLDAAMKDGSALYDRWEKFSFDGIVAVARAMAEEIHKVSPETRLAYQHGPYRNDSQIAVYRALHEATGLPVGGRLGGGGWYDYDPNGQMEKAFEAARQRRNLHDLSYVEAWCAEIETWPRAFASRTAQGVMNEALASLAVGENCLSFFMMDPKIEKDEWYAENLLTPLAAERPLLEAYRRHNEGTVPAGFADATTVTPEALYRFALAGVPVMPGPGKSCGEVTDADLAGFDIRKMSSSALLNLRRKMDERSGGKAPIVVETPAVGLFLPRVAADGSLRSVAVVNARIDVQKPVRLRLRNVPSSVKSATWWAFHSKPVSLSMERLVDGDAAVVIPEIGAWNAGFLCFETGAGPDNVFRDNEERTATAAVALVPAPKAAEWREGVRLFSEQDVRYVHDDTLPREGYRLDIAPDAITVASADDAGAFYAMKTLKQLSDGDGLAGARLSQAKWFGSEPPAQTVPCGTVTDCPAFRWRGFLLDEGRHFFGKEAVKGVLDRMADHKLNVFHWHLTEDQGWRLAIERFPELVQYGSVRLESPVHGCRGNPEDYRGNGQPYGPYFYTASDVREILAYAKERFITVVPEIEIPGHVRALLAAHPEFACRKGLPRVPRTMWGVEPDVLCAGNDDAIRFMEQVYDEVCKLFPGAYIHIGGDECPKDRWKECPKCQARIKSLGLKDEDALQAWVTRHFTEYLAKRGRRAVGWDEILSGDPCSDVVVQTWHGAELAERAAKAGHDVIVSAPWSSLYFSIPQGVEDDPFTYLAPAMRLPLEKVYSVDPTSGISPEAKGRILGAECCMWSECVWNECDLAFKLWPRACAFAEAVWTAPPEPRDFADFSRRMAVHRKRLIAAGTNCAPLE